MKSSNEELFFLPLAVFTSRLALSPPSGGENEDDTVPGVWEAAHLSSCCSGSGPTSWAWGDLAQHHWLTGRRQAVTRTLGQARQHRVPTWAAAQYLRKHRRHCDSCHLPEEFSCDLGKDPRDSCCCRLTRLTGAVTSPPPQAGPRPAPAGRRLTQELPRTGMLPAISYKSVPGLLVRQWSFC